MKTPVMYTAIVAVLAFACAMSLYSSYQAMSAGRAWQKSYELTLRELEALKASADCTLPGEKQANVLHGGRLIVAGVAP